MSHVVLADGWELKAYSFRWEVPMKVSEIAELLYGTLAGDAGREIHGVAALEAAGPAEPSAR